MNILIDNAGFVNKGAELMLYAAREKLGEMFPKVNFACRSKVPENSNKGIYELREQKRQNLIPVKFIPTFVLKNVYGYLTPGKINHIIDAGGFRLGDQWENHYSNEHINIWLNIYKEIKEAGGKNIFLPQAFGPFKKNFSRQFIEAIYPYIDLLMAREDQSYEYLVEIFGENEKVKLFPDFTNIYHPERSPENKALFERFGNGVCLIPNKKMITHAEKEVAAKYVVLMAGLAKEIKRIGENVFFLNHEGPGDEKLIKEIIKETGESFDYVSGINADEVKWIIGQCKMVITSRFHGLVSALSQGVPAFCTSWSHKYQELLKDYEQEENLLDVEKTNQSIDNVISALQSDAWLIKTNAILIKNSETQKVRTLEMWGEVERVLRKQ